jgi:hypothetical protein
MSQAIFALLGALIGAFGAVSSNLIVVRRADARSQRDALRTAATEFAAAISRIRHLSYQARPGVENTELDLKFQEAHTAARVEYETPAALRVVGRAGGGSLCPAPCLQHLDGGERYLTPHGRVRHGWPLAAVRQAPQEYVCRRAS